METLLLQRRTSQSYRHPPLSYQIRHQLDNLLQIMVMERDNKTRILQIIQLSQPIIDLNFSNFYLTSEPSDADNKRLSISDLSNGI